MHPQELLFIPDCHTTKTTHLSQLSFLRENREKIFTWCSSFFHLLAPIFSSVLLHKDILQLYDPDSWWERSSCISTNDSLPHLTRKMPPVHTLSFIYGPCDCLSLQNLCIRVHTTVITVVMFWVFFSTSGQLFVFKQKWDAHGRQLWWKTSLSSQLGFSHSQWICPFCKADISSGFHLTCNSLQNSFG